MKDFFFEDQLYKWYFVQVGIFTFFLEFLSGVYGIDLGGFVRSCFSISSILDLEHI